MKGNEKETLEKKAAVQAEKLKDLKLPSDLSAETKKEIEASVS
jgi:hypothetical protein